MKQKTHAQSIIAYLISNGEKQVDYNTHKYTVLTRHHRLMDGSSIPESATPVYWYVGTMGALRVGTSIKDSRPVREEIRAEVIRRGRELS
ncbi:MAG: hypothetical protein BWY79_01337 [Actinobacteria bacterium ADurb.Bin444]|nr:MAG: hypothetical protein BWY79_01337 [Actinobacteria bacterium ADurb.Bin444]